MHPYHHTVYGPSGISQTLLGQWLGLRQPQISRIETGPPIPNLDTLVYWARILRIPAELLWFKLPDDKSQLATGEPPSPGAPPAPDTNDEHADDPERDPVLIAPWNHQGTVEVAVVLSGGEGRAKRRVFLSLTGPALTASAH
jgi:transcriptional regulator with XRE-family HTH domain